MYHPILQKKVDHVEEELTQVHKELRAATQLLAARGLLPILDSALAASVIEDHIYTAGQGRSPADRYWITVDVDAERKDHLRYFLLRGFDSYEKRYTVRHSYTDKPDQLIESWVTTWDPTNPGRYGPSAWNQLTVNFLQPAIEGAKLTPTCSVQLVTQESHSKTENLSVVCSK